MTDERTPDERIADDLSEGIERECEGHPGGPVIGETFYCDGSCQPLAVVLVSDHSGLD